MPPSWRLLFDESLSPKLVELLVGDLCRGSKSALRNGLAGAGDSRILEHASAGNFILVRRQFRTSVESHP
jgi:predicted nuclease of predicted toxin-antitoxin system